MSLLQRLFGRTNAAVTRDPAPAPAPASPAAPPRAPTTSDDPPIDAKHIDDIIRVEEVSDAEFYAGDLFRRRFRGNPPDFPKHYVAFYRQGRTQYLPVGYIHYSAFEDTWLCGGMVIDDRLYRRIPDPHRKLIKDAGGIAEIMLRTTFARLADAPAIWGYVGDKQAEEVDVRAGFRHTHHEHVMVVWNRELPDDEKAARLARVIALGPF
ncbi:MAG TPA: hypothetical protein VNG69_11915 [Casimicrobiaceae bacterium]|nr:hypothetical protein [Casimicrobiaceae bacterium]